MCSAYVTMTLETWGYRKANVHWMPISRGFIDHFQSLTIISIAFLGFVFEGALFVFHQNVKFVELCVALRLKFFPSTTPVIFIAYSGNENDCDSKARGFASGTLAERCTYYSAMPGQ